MPFNRKIMTTFVCFTMLTMTTRHNQAPPPPPPPPPYLLTGQLCDYWESMALCATPELLSSPRSS